MPDMKQQIVEFIESRDILSVDIDQETVTTGVRDGYAVLHPTGRVTITIKCDRPRGGHDA